VLFSNICISQDSIATRLRCCENILHTYYWKFHPLSSSERISKIGQNLAKLLPKAKCHLLVDTVCTVFVFLYGILCRLYLTFIHCFLLLLLVEHSRFSCYFQIYLLIFFTTGDFSKTAERISTKLSRQTAHGLE